jgi:hypothetical protein
MRENINEMNAKEAKKATKGNKKVVFAILAALLLLAAVLVVIFFGRCIIGKHNFEYVSDASTHRLSCKSCGKEGESEAHSLDRFEDCSVCGRKSPISTSVTYRSSADGKYAEAESLVGSPTKIKISSGFNNLPVKGIKASAFEKSSVKEVIISEGVEYIGLSSFEGCLSLNRVVLPDSLTTIGTSAFKNCKALSEIVIPKGVEKINNGAFDGCDALTDVYFMGTKDEWETMYKSIGNEILDKINIHFNYAY